MILKEDLEYITKLKFKVYNNSPRITFFFSFPLSYFTLPLVLALAFCLYYVISFLK